MPFATINQQEIHFTDHGGAGLPIILSHGFLMDEQMFVHQVAALSPEFRVITWDERGFGQTHYDGKPFTYWDSARDCLGLLAHLDIQQAVLGGMSQGGFLSLRAALLAPERILGLVLMDTQAGPEAVEHIEQHKQLLQTWISSSLTSEMAEYVANVIISEPAENAKWIAKWKAMNPQQLAYPGSCLIQREDISDRLAEISAPALVIHGSDDHAITLNLAEALCHGLKSSEPLVLVEGAGHAANLTHAEQVNPPLLAFLRRLATHHA
jgi:pimeloyl-ACP methyl ester carboxylesterase